MRNPKWHRDEIILALDLYFRTEPGQIHNRNPEIIELSEILNILPIHRYRPDQEKFRNPNGVGLKLSNFLAIDSKYPGKGMSRFSNLDKAIFDEFKDNHYLLHIIAKQIRQVVANTKFLETLYQIPDEKEEGLSEVKEGRVLYKAHRTRERDMRIINQKKEKVLDEKGKLACEVCNFDYEQFYGGLGRGFIEAHHIIPFALTNFERKTKLIDLALVCANCHRMLHRKGMNYSLDFLRVEMENRGWPLL